MLNFFRRKISSSLCQQCRGIGLVAAPAIIPCDCNNGSQEALVLRCAHCAGSRTIAVEVDNACPSCRGTALNKRRAA